MEDQHQEMPPRNSNTWQYVLLGVFALAIIGLSIWLISVKKEVKILKTEKEVQKWEFQRELDSTIMEHMKTKQAYGEISDSLAGMDSLFQANAAEIKSLLNYKWDYYKVRKKLSSLQVVAQGYVRKMDSIVVVNELLTEENLQFQEEIKIEKRKNKQLEEQKGNLEVLVDEASILTVYNLEAIPVYVKGGGKEVPTDKIKRVKRVNVCFTLSENSILEPGKKTLYVRIAGPDKEILTKGRNDDQYTFVHNGEVLQFSINKEVDYQNEAIELCLQYNLRESQELEVGLYHIDLFEGDNNIGHTTFSLK